MIEYISGKVVQVTPTFVVIDNGGLGYLLHISLATCSQLVKNENIQLFVHEVVREDAYELFGFADERERAVFRLLISVSGVGANTARMMLSKLSAGELEKAIMVGDENLLKSIKGIGLKTAQRIIVDLQDKVGKIEGNQDLFLSKNNTSKEEALSALVILGFQKNNVDKILDKLIAEMKEATVEELVKQALKRL